MPRSLITGTARENIRSLNQSAVLNAIHHHGQISRIALAAELKLSPAAVTDITSTLIEKGLVFEARQGTSNTVGRKPILLEVNYDYAFVLGVKVSNVAVTMVLTNLKAEVLGHCNEPLENHDVVSVLTAIEQTAECLQTECGVSNDKLMGLGVNLPGIIEHETGRVRHSPLLGWYDVPFAHVLQERLSLPVLVENDVNALAAAEAWFGSGKQHNAFLVLTLGRGVGLGIVHDGNVYRGPRGGAGEFGHITITPPAATASQRAGALETFLSDSALLERARARIRDFPANADLEDLARLAEEGQVDAIALFKEAGRTLGLAMSYLVNIFAPTLIVLSGEGVRNAPYLLPSAKSTLQAHSFGDLAESLEIVVDSWGDDAWARGAAGLAASRCLTQFAESLGGDR